AADRFHFRTLFVGGASRTSEPIGARTGTRSQSWTACTVRWKRQLPGHAARVAPRSPGRTTAATVREKGYLMFITVTKAFTSAVVLTAIILDPAGANRPLLLLVVFAGAIVVAVQAARLHESIWGFGFVMLGLLFNPLLTISFSSAVARWLDLVCLVT